MANILTRRSFMSASFKATAAVGLASLMNIPPFLKRALAEGSIGVNGKKLLFIFLRGGNDGVNNILPIQDPAYLANRVDIGIPKDPNAAYGAVTGQADSVTFADQYPHAIPLGNGFAALNPALVDLVPIFNAGNLALIHRVAYRKQSTSHFDSERYWEKATDGISANNRLVSDGIWYRTMVESGWNKTHALSAVSIQPNMPQSLRGVEPMTNITSINRYNILGVSNPSGSFNQDRAKILDDIDAANHRPYAEKDNRALVHNLGIAFRDTLDIFRSPTFQNNDFYDLDGTTKLFPTTNTEDNVNAALRRQGGSFGFIGNIKSCAQILSDTDAIIAGTEFGSFDTHTAQTAAGTPHLGGHTNLLRRLAWAYYALWRYFSSKNMWDKVIVITMSEFGRTSAENANNGTDHAEASVMYVAGGGVTGGVYGCDTNIPRPAILPSVKNWVPWDGVGTNPKLGSLFAANSNVGYLKRLIDYRSVVGEIIRDHLGATQPQLNRIIPAYANENVEHLKNGGTVTETSGSTTPILGELSIV
jgi:uncharacterized protein (DUF1501 family)